MEELIETIVKALVDHPDDVRIEEVETSSMVTYQLSVNSEDMGKVIGKQGRIAKAIRTVINAAGINESKKINLEIV